MLNVKLHDGTGKGNRAKILSTGALVVSPPDYDDAIFNTLDVAGTGYTYFKPLSGKQFVMTGAVAFADKDVSDNTDTVIVIYESDGASSTTEDKVLLQFGMGKLTSLHIAPLNILLNKGKWLNAKTGDDDIHMTITGYYINEI